MVDFGDSRFIFKVLVFSNELFVFAANSICKVMAMRAMKNGKLGSSLTWCLRSKVR